MNKFQIIFTAVFVLFIIVGVSVFALYRGGNQDTGLPTIEVWGTMPADTFAQFIQRFNFDRQTAILVNYVEKRPEQFDEDFIETLARGGGPDAVLLSQDMILRHEDKLIKIPYEALPERAFRDTYIREAEKYLTPSGILALPFSIDPLVMYWNRDIYTNAGLPTYPKFWDEFRAIIPRITLKDVNSNIRRSTVSLGEFKNVTHAREILGTLMMQSGNPVTVRSDRVVSAIGDGSIAGSNTSQPALEFFTKFADPREPDYTWNRSLSESRAAFLSGSLATYFGFASELIDIREKNPNIDFDVAPLPQARDGKNRTTYGTMYGFSIVRSTASPDATYAVLSELVSEPASAAWTEVTFLPPVRRATIALGTTDPYLSIFYDSAVIADDWLDADPAKSREIFARMVESVTSGQKTLYEAIDGAHRELEIVLGDI